MISKTLTALITAALCAAAHANDAITAANNQVSFSLGGHKMLYHELDNHQTTGGKYLDSEHGYQPTTQLAASRQGTLLGIDKVYTAAALTLTRGHTSYEGYAIALSSPNGHGDHITQSKTGTMVDLDLKLGRGFEIASPNFQLTPYLGYGYHHWTRDSIETYSWSTVSLGLLAQYALTPKLVVSAELSYGKTLDPQLRTQNGINVGLGSRPSRSASLGVDYAMSKRLHLKASYQINNYAFGESDVVAGRYAGVNGIWYEPTSRTTRQALMVGVAWSF
jgi:predicted porin